MGSTRLVTDAYGAVVASYKFKPYGETDSYSGTFSTNYQFTGKPVNADVGLSYYGARWYDPEIGRFITQDPIKNGTNWYVYCDNNPIKYIDPSGLDSESSIGGLGDSRSEGFNGLDNSGSNGFGGVGDPSSIGFSEGSDFSGVALPFSTEEDTPLPGSFGPIGDPIPIGRLGSPGPIIDLSLPPIGPKNPITGKSIFSSKNGDSDTWGTSLSMRFCRDGFNLYNFMGGFAVACGGVLALASAETTGPVGIYFGFGMCFAGGTMMEQSFKQ